MGICFNRDKDDYLQYDGRYVYCETCLAKVPYDQVYIMAHCMNKTHIFVVVSVIRLGCLKNNLT